MKPKPRYDDPVPGAGFETLCSHFAEDAQSRDGAAAPPIFQTSTFIYPDAAEFGRRRNPQSPRHDYTRVSNPTTQVLEAKLARLERAEWAEVFASGMGAICAALGACLDGGTHVVCAAHAYGPTRSWLGQMRRFGVSTTYVRSVETAVFMDAITPQTRVLYFESPTSGYFECPGVATIALAARERGVRTIFDNSWASPYFMNPLDLGVDLVVHSATKYLNGHSDVVAGVVAGRDWDLHAKVFRELELGGACIDPFAAWLMIRGLRTLAVRMEQHQRAGLEIARWLESHEKVARVLHPGLESHPQHAVAVRQLRGFSGLFSLLLKEQTRDATHRFLDRLRLFGQGVSWGGFESLAIGGTFFDDNPARPEWVIRLSIGLESVADLLADIRQALED